MNPEIVSNPLDVDGGGEDGPNTGAQIRELAGVAFQYKWLILAITVATTFTVFTLAAREPKRYQATATVVVSLSMPKILNGVSEVSGPGAITPVALDFYYTTQFKILESKALLTETIARLKIGPRVPRWLEKAEGTGGPQFLAKALAAIKGRIQIAGVKLSELVNITATDTDPEDAQILANTLAEAYVEHNLKQKTEASRNALIWLETQGVQLEGKLRLSELALNQFKRDNDVVSLSMEERQNMVASELGALMSSLSETRIKRMHLASQMAELDLAAKTPGEELSLALLPNGEYLKNLIGRRKQLELSLAQVQVRYMKDHPKSVEIETEVAKIDLLIKREIPAALNTLRRELNSVKRFETELVSRLATIKAEALDLNGKQIDFNQIQRDYETNKNLYSMVLTRSKETNLTGRLETNNVRLLDRADLPKTSIGLRLPVKVLAGCLGGLVFGIIVAFGLAMLDDTVKSQEDIANRLRLPFLGIVPCLDVDAQITRGQAFDEPQMALMVHTHPRSMTAESCRGIRSNLLFMSPDTPITTLAVISPHHADGKTNTAAKLAITLSQTQGKTLIVDADMRRPRLHRIFGVPNETGLSTFMANECSLDEAIKRTAVPGVDVLTSGRIPPSAAELLHSKRFASMIAELKTRYSAIVFDTPPVLPVTDAVIVATHVDGVVLVARWRKTTRQALHEVEKTIRGVGGRLLGVVLNDINPTKGAYYYRYKSYRRYRLYGYGEQT